VVTLRDSPRSGSGAWAGAPTGRCASTPAGPGKMSLRGRRTGSPSRGGASRSWEKPVEAVPRPSRPKRADPLAYSPKTSSRGRQLLSPTKDPRDPPALEDTQNQDAHQHNDDEEEYQPIVPHHTARAYYPRVLRELPGPAPQMHRLALLGPERLARLDRGAASGTERFGTRRGSGLR
jgi:hypothetical protein